MPLLVLAASQKSRTLLVYSGVVSSNVVGNSEHPLIHEMHYRQDDSGVVYFEPTHIQWMPMRREYLDVIEVILGESTGQLATFAGGGRTIVTFQFRKETRGIKKQTHREESIIIVMCRGSLTRYHPPYLRG